MKRKTIDVSEDLNSIMGSMFSEQDLKKMMTEKDTPLDLFGHAARAKLSTIPKDIKDKYSNVDEYLEILKHPRLRRQTAAIYIAPEIVRLANHENRYLKNEVCNYLTYADISIETIESMVASLKESKNYIILAKFLSLLSVRVSKCANSQKRVAQEDALANIVNKNFLHELNEIIHKESSSITNLYDKSTVIYWLEQTLNHLLSTPSRALSILNYILDEPKLASLFQNILGSYASYKEIYSEKFANRLVAIQQCWEGLISNPSISKNLSLEIFNKLEKSPIQVGNIIAKNKHLISYANDNNLNHVLLNAFSSNPNILQEFSVEISREMVTKAYLSYKIDSTNYRNKTFAGIVYKYLSDDITKEMLATSSWVIEDKLISEWILNRKNDAVLRYMLTNISIYHTYLCNYASTYMTDDEIALYKNIIIPAYKASAKGVCLDAMLCLETKLNEEIAKRTISL